MTGGGERSLGDMGQRGRSLGSAGKAAFCGMGALIVVSDTVGRSWGTVAEENGFRATAADDGIELIALADRVGLGSWWLFFLDHPPARLWEFDVSSDRIGEDSREGLGEFVVDVVCVLDTFFGAGNEEFEGWVFELDGRADDWWSAVVIKVFDGSAISGAPVTEW
jgi:hypothetical protein